MARENMDQGTQLYLFDPTELAPGVEVIDPDGRLVATGSRRRQPAKRRGKERGMPAVPVRDPSTARTKEAVMQRVLKRWVGSLCGVAGLALTGVGLAGFAEALHAPAQGVGFFVPATCAIGFALLGAAHDFLSGRRRNDSNSANGIAHSIWASTDHLQSYNLTDE
jgi:hypothetical protein